jgi:pilus assembly protein CpaE
MTTIKDIKVQLAIRTEPLADNFRNIVAETAGLEVEESGSGPAGLLILELGRTPEQDFNRIDTLLAENKVREIFLTGETPDPNILMRAMRLGVKEFFPLPLNPGDVRTALDRFMERNIKAPPADAQVKKGRIISICGGKGGVGTTTVAVNLAVAYSNRKQPLSVALLDMNTIFGEIPLFLEISPKFHWGEITKNIERLDNTFLMNVLTRHSSGVHVLPSPAYLNGHHQPTPSIMQRLLGLMRQLFDVVIIDGGQSLNDAALKGMQMSDAVLLVSTLSLPCLSNTNKLLRSFTDLGYIQKERIKVILNRYLKKNEITLEDAEAGIGQQVFFSIPNDYKTTMAAINSGKPLSELAPQSSIAGSIIELAEKLIPMEPGETKKRWSLFKR